MLFQPIVNQMLIVWQIFLLVLALFLEYSFHFPGFNLTINITTHVDCAAGTVCRLKKTSGLVSYKLAQTLSATNHCSATRIVIIIHSNSIYHLATYMTRAHCECLAASMFGLCVCRICFDWLTLACGTMLGERTESRFLASFHQIRLAQDGSL